MFQGRSLRQVQLEVSPKNSLGQEKSRKDVYLHFCKKRYEKKAYDKFTAWFDGRSLPFLEDALVDYSKDRMGGQLTIKAPNAKMPRVDENSPLEDRINYVLYNEVNPALAAHGGEVSLVEITEDQFAVLQFGGGCQGCSAVDQTLKGGVEKTLLEQVPQLKGVRDMTDHTDKSQAYY